VALSRIQKLARRVGWLDRNRRKLAIALALLLSPLMISRLGDLLGADWPRFHATLLAVMGVLCLWCAIEIGLAWLTALWETECAHLMRSAQTLPRAILRKG
jgi:hypothetical protein